MFKAVIFDWDGTLADTRLAVVNSFQRVLEQIGCKVTDDFIERRIGIGPINTFKEALTTRHIVFDDKLLEKLTKKKVELQIRLLDTIELFEGAVDLLDALREKLKIALASMNNKEVIDKLISQKKIKKYFNIIVTVEDVTHPKPDPEIFLKCAKKLGYSPDRCVVIEDSIFGVRAAKEAGMKCIAVSTGAYSRHELKEAYPELIVHSIGERTKILGFILNGAG